MRFLGFDFVSIHAPANIRYTPPGWNDQITAVVRRSAAQARTQLPGAGGAGQRQLTPIEIQPQMGPLPNLACSEVINSLVDAAAGSTTPVKAFSKATDLPTILSQRADVLDYAGMKQVMCAGFMLATFQYDFSDTNAAQDIVVGTAYNLAKTIDGKKVKHTALHSKNVNDDQVHTEQLLCKELDGFLALLRANAAQAVVVNAHDRKAFADSKFDLKNVSLNVKIVFEHVQNNVKSDCAACSKTIEETLKVWESQCKAMTITVAKNS